MSGLEHSQNGNGHKHSQSDAPVPRHSLAGAADFELRASHQLLDEAGVMLTGLSSDMFVGVKLMRPAGTSPEGPCFECVTCMGQVGLRWAHARVPYVQAWKILPSDMQAVGGFRTMSGQLLADVPNGGMMAEFTTKPLPTVRCSISGTFLIQSIQFAPDAPERVAYFSAVRHIEILRHDRRDEGKRYSVVPRIPTRLYVEDMWMHESVELSKQPTAGIYLPASRLIDGPLNGRDFDRIAELPAPRELGRGLEQAALPERRGHAHLTRWLFEALGWNPDEFEGYRLRAPNPLWAMEYISHFPSLDRPRQPAAEEPAQLSCQPA